jgi:predicted metalloprotease with PDZ domain
MTQAVDYRVDLSDRHAHLYAVEGKFTLDGISEPHVDFMLPVWTPGSYLVREFERHLQEVTAVDDEGRPLPIRKLDKATWRVERLGARGITMRYRVYAFDLTVRSAHLDDTHGFWNGACLFLYTAAHRARPHRVTVVAPAGWKTTVGLDPDESGRFVARDYDELVDSPFEVGTHELIELEARGKRHRIAIWGRVETPRDELTADFKKIIDAAATLFDPEAGSLPYDHYTFILLSSPNQYGGLEHARSTAILCSPYTFKPRKKYEEFLELVSHEYFHLWNVKRIRPAALGPFDYQREAYTRSLWVMEGMTSYYDRYLLVRAGLLGQERYLEKLGDELTKIRAQPGRFRQSLEESSFDAWIKLYRPDENTPNSTISYYLKGGVVCLLLDLTIRARTEGARSLDDVMRALWRRYQETGAGFEDAALQGIMEEAVGVNLTDFFDQFVRGRDELEPNAILKTVGLTARHPDDGDDDGDDKQGWLGAQLKEGDVGVRVAHVVAGSPAVSGGLYANDEIIALDGFRVDHGGLKDRLSVRKPGARCSFTVFRRDELRTVEVTLGAPPPDEKLEIVPHPEATDREKAAYRAWLGGDFPSAD